MSNLVKFLYPGTNFPGAGYWLTIALMDAMTGRIYSFVLARRKEGIRLFFALYGVLVLILLVGGRSVFVSDSYALFFHSVGVFLGESALCVFVVVLVPGMARRFGIKHKIVSLLRIFRRYLGILMFMLALVHSSLVAIIPRLPSWPDIFTFAQFEWWGLAALTVLFFMFLTSNDRSIAVLKIWWYRLHRLVYAVMFFVLIHTGLQRIGTWSVVAGLLVAAMLWSFIYEWRRKKSTMPPSQGSQTP